MANWRTLQVLGAVSLSLLATNQESAAQILNAKRGFADYSASYDYIKATGAAWYYTWSLDDASVGSYDADFYPMFKHGYDVTSGNITNVINRNPEYVLGFNEPERADQGNTTVSAAVTEWNQLYDGLSGTDIKLVSPAVSDTGDGQAWINSFMSQMSSKVDAVAFHWYGASTPDDPASAASSFMSRVNHYKSWGKPVFITEFAIHDWGGNYSDAAITEANRQFLNIVLPQLDSDPNVLGYAWYPWFNDARIFDTGNPPLPTEMGYRYVGVVRSGQVEDIGNKNLGEHTAYLAGGEITQTGATPATIRYIQALENTSTISGTLNWGLAGTGSPWVRIRSGAVLRKSGTNQITFGSGSLTNSGLLDVVQGTLRIGVSATGNGQVRILGGTLALFGSGRLNTAPLIDVRPVGSLDVTALGTSFNVNNGQTLNVERNGTVAGNVTAAVGSTISSAGTIAGNLTALSGSTIRVGKDGVGVPTRVLIDNFESYAEGDVRSVASPPWTPHQDTTLADIETNNGNKVLTYGWASGIRGLSRNLTDAAVIENDETSTLFFRINSKTNDPDHNFGLADQATTSGGDFADFEAQLRMNQGTGSTFNLDARNGGAFTSTLASGLALNTWHNIWMVVNNATDRYDIYMNTGNGAATAGNKLNTSQIAFRNGTTNALNTILGLSNTAPIDNGVRIDDIHLFAGTDLTNPIGGLDPGLGWTAETLAVTGNYTQVNGATLQLNLLGPDHHDVLSVTGQANVDGTLNISFAVGAPSPAVGNEFDILHFGSLTGIFNSVVLPTLSTGLVWDNSELLSNGILAIKAGLLGDFNDDGNVDAADYVAWRDTLGAVGAGLAADANADLRVDQSDYTLWRANFGASLNNGSASTADASKVPEPSTALLAALFITAAAFTSATRRRELQSG